MDDQITQLTSEFSRKLMDAFPEFQELAQAKKDLDADPTSKKLWAEKEEHKETVELMKKKGLPISTEQEWKLSIKLKEMRENPITMRYLKATNLANKVSGKIGSELFNLTGADFSPRKGCK